MDRSTYPRWVNVMLGGWLFASAFLWVHTARQFNNSWVVGVATIILATMAVAFSQMRFANTVLAVWLAFSAWVLPKASQATEYNNLIVAVAILVTSMIPNRPGRHPWLGSRHPHGPAGVHR